jgi:hypothetical protein
MIKKMKKKLTRVKMAYPTNGSVIFMRDFDNVLVRSRSRYTTFAITSQLASKKLHEEFRVGLEQLGELWVLLLKILDKGLKESRVLFNLLPEIS